MAEMPHGISVDDAERALSSPETPETGLLPENLWFARSAASRSYSPTSPRSEPSLDFEAGLVAEACVMRQASFASQDVLCTAAFNAVTKVLQKCKNAACTIADTDFNLSVFGSRSTGLAEESSDLDLEVQVWTPSADNEEARHAMAAAWMQLV